MNFPLSSFFFLLSSFFLSFFLSSKNRIYCMRQTDSAGCAWREYMMHYDLDMFRVHYRVHASSSTDTITDSLLPHTFIQLGRNHLRPHRTRTPIIRLSYWASGP